MKTTYRAMQASKPGVLELVERETPTPGNGEVLIEIEACGICGADGGAIENPNPNLASPRIPGHEVVGRIKQLGENVPSIWQLGQRVGVGRLGGHCNECTQCRKGKFELCQNQNHVGASVDGGYAEMMLARATGLVAIPDALDAEEAAPILCAGIATFNGLKKSGATAGDTVAILGIGGLGHMALQYAHKMGFRVIAIGRGSDIKEEVLALGAHHYIDSHEEDAAAALKAMGGANAIISTITDADTVSALMPGLAPEGQMVLLGVGANPIAVSPGQMIVGERGVLGSITGSPYDNERTLDFSVLTGVRPQIETFPLEQANEAYQRVKSGEAKFRVVLTMNQ